MKFLGKKLSNFSSAHLLFVIFLIALVVRFQHFPKNIYFGYDQARDAFESQNIYSNFDLKIVGPPTANPELFHGPLYWYVVGPLYLLGGGSPVIPAAFIIVYNAVGVFLIYWLGKLIFNSRVGIFAALLYAVSFEQTQYAIYFHHPPVAVLTIMLFYGGLALSIFKKDWRGIPLSLIGYGLSIQSEFQLLYLGLIFVFLLILFRKKVLHLIEQRTVFASVLVFVLSVSTFILAEIKYGLRTTKGIWNMIVTPSSNDYVYSLGTYVDRVILQVRDNIWGFGAGVFILVGILVLSFIFAKKSKEIEKVVFLVVWFFSVVIVILFGPIKLYYTFVGISPAILLLASYFISKLNFRLIFLVLGVVVVSNLSLVKNQNLKGVISDIQVQEGMLLGRELEVIDFVYSESDGLPVVVSALTMPLKINTTWAYLFSWYGQQKYGYVPYWAGEVAPGYPGSLPKWKSQEEKYMFFSIIEPRRGVRDAFVEKFLEDQKQYGDVVEERVYGDKVYNRLIVQKRVN